ncbi:MAG: hypothetical protein EOQ52_21050 [Mesorhizobium sp.]|uniref:hypothetical protein n=1 Tax=Mesorhizobium sp. TaxID=1871066 RepID=UPI000FE780EE|nr:hypothetical protein [Mesorhizobium sp.]RWB85432.1 MAG: hypothetical protein EOQ52_21050 [Mesorhizobium sp.]RWC97758.1 MAG: hypothetical protein EOS32_02975 [Mesorhizobium sp.]TIS65628.1 MAG: hypothetical protein E5W93_00965 [Mesorhizobium sp.]
MNDAELAAIWTGCEPEPGDIGYSFGSIVKLLMLTGQRRTEVAAMRDPPPIGAARHQEPQLTIDSLGIRVVAAPLILVGRIHRHIERVQIAFECGFCKRTCQTRNYLPDRTIAFQISIHIVLENRLSLRGESLR